MYLKITVVLQKLPHSNKQQQKTKINKNKKNKPYYEVIWKLRLLLFFTKVTEAGLPRV